MIISFFKCWQFSKQSINPISHPLTVVSSWWIILCCGMSVLLPEFLTFPSGWNYWLGEVSCWGNGIENMNPLDLHHFFKQSCSEDRWERIRNPKSLHLSGSRWEGVWGAEVRQRCHCQLSLYDFPRILNQQSDEVLRTHSIVLQFNCRPPTVTARKIHF